jgi:hypothetical protein
MASIKQLSRQDGASTEHHGMFRTDQYFSVVLDQIKPAYILDIVFAESLCITFFIHHSPV